jgi:subtilisin-like proprotein convertase family protein
VRLRLCLIIPFLFTQLFIWKANAQFCNPVDTFVVIQDNQSTSIQITVDGVVNNDLSNPFQGLCALQISFEHDQVSDLSITLTSPSGQEITLVGPYLVNFPTTFADWSVIFTQCSAPASPDPGFPSTWTNEASWAALGDYSGTYYPYQGCLEDFDTGPVNGTWTLNITDNIQFDAGSLISINLLFCDPEGVDCDLCQSNGGEIMMSDSSYCQGDPALDFSVPEVKFDSVPDQNLYRYEFIRILNDTIHALDAALDFTALDTGVYQLCGISYHKNDSAFWNGLAEGQAYSDLLDLVLAPNSTFCADLSENCIEIEILPTDLMLDTTLLICQGDTLFFEGEAYTETGDYFLVDNSTSPCGRSIFLHIENYDIQTEIRSDGFQLTCSENTIELEGHIDSPYDDIEHYWVTEGGGFLTSPDSLTVEVGQPGLYHFITLKNNCPDTSSITIVSDGSLPEYLVSAGTIDCFNEEITIQLFPISPVSEVKWITPDNDDLFVEDPMVSEPGIYTLELTGENGCIAIGTVEVDIDTLRPQISLIADTLSCTHPQTVIDLNSDKNLFQVYWPELATFQEDPITGNPGTYHVEAMGLNGCITLDSIEIIGDFNFPVFSLDFDTLDCYNDSILIDLSSPSEDLIYNWTDPNNNTFDTEDLWAYTGGNYHLSVSNEENCTVDTSILLPENFSLPDLSLSDTLFIPCNEDFIQLDLVILSDYDSLLWKGPGNFSSSAGNPFVSVTGIYSIEITGTNGCIRTDTTVVALPPEIPEINVEIDTINCGNDVGTIDLIYTGDLSFSWEDEMGNPYSGPSISSGLAGDYMLTVTDNTFNCTSELIITLPIDTLPPSFDFADVDTITCIAPTTILTLSSEAPIDEAHWTGPGLNAFGNAVPVNTAGWYFVEVTGSNHCVSEDSIQIFESDSFLGTADSFYIDCVADSIQISLPPVDVDSYTWSFEGTSFSNLEAPYVYTAGTYTLVVNTIEGCTDSAEVQVYFDQELPEFELMLLGELNCIDSSAIVNAIPASTLIDYEWLGPGLNSSNLSDTIYSEGSYYFTATGENMCEKTDSIIVMASRDFPEVIAIGDSVNCYDDDQSLSIDADITGPYSSILWQGPDFYESFSLQNSVQDTGLYILRVEGSKGCYSYDSTLVLIDTLPPAFDFIRPDTITCFEESVELNINSEENIVDLLWTGNDNFSSKELPVAVNQAGTYWLMIQGENGCISTASIEVPQNKLRPYLSLEAEDISCNRVKIPIILSSSASSIFAEWSGPNNYGYTGIDAVVKDTGMYYVLITDLLNGCQNTDSIWVGSNLEPPVILTEDYRLGCNGNPISIGAEVDPPQVNYVWSGPSSFQSFDKEPDVLLPGTYYVTVTRQDNGCATEDSLRVLDEPEYPEISLDYEDLDCAKDSTILDYRAGWQHRPGGMERP